MTRHLLPALIAAAVFAPAAAQDLGRLFFSPQQREEFDQRRASGVKDDIVVPPAETLTVSGHVSRSSGKTTTWINGVPQNDLYRGADPSRVTLQAAEDKPGVAVKIGQTLDTTSGETRDTLGASDIKVNRGARGRR